MDSGILSKSLKHRLGPLETWTPWILGPFFPMNAEKANYINIINQP